MKDVFKISKGVIPLILAIILAGYLLKNDFAPFMSWWFVLFLLGLIFLPLTNKIFYNFSDNGYLFAKTIGLALTGYLMWLLSTLRILKFTSISCVIVVVIALIINIIIYYVGKKDNNQPLVPSNKWNLIITEEVMFFIIFLIWTYIRGFKPEAYGTEKFMDYGFMTTMMRSQYMPPEDLWFAGESINYYYVGQYLATYMTKLSFVTVNVGYNLMLMTLAALGFMLPFSIVYNVLRNSYEENNKPYKKAPVIGGLLSGAGVCLAGNIHFVLYYFIVPVIRTILELEGEFSKYWFPDSTRYIGYNPETTDKTIHEFPSYSFVLGDLHAHVLNIIFVLTVLAILYAWLLNRKKWMKDIYLNSDELKLNLLTEVINPCTLTLGFFIGLFRTTNFWDFPIYYVVSGAIILFSNLKIYGLKKNLFTVTALQGIFIFLFGGIIALPFTLNFDQISTEIRLAVSHTPLFQLIILWGLPVFLICTFVTHLCKESKEKDSVVVLYGNVTLENKKEKNVIIRLIKNTEISDLFIVTIGLCAIGLVLIPEIIYVKDIYSGDYKRANTMFKLTYQAFIMFGIALGYILVKFIGFGKYHFNKTVGYFTLILFLLTLWYSKVSIGAWYGNIFKVGDYKGLDSAAFMETTMYDDYLATNWLNDNLEGMPVVLEANGDSYSDYQRVSVITGLPTVLGWHVHEWLWRGDVSVVDSRAADIKTIYTSDNREEVLELINKYDIEYIYVGKLENDKYDSVNSTLIKELGDIVFMSEKQNEKQYETYIVRIDR